MRSSGSYSRYLIALTVAIGGLLVAQDLSSVQVSKTYSPNKKYGLEIIPKGCDNNDSGCLGNFYAADTLGNYQLKSSWILLNPIAPVTALLSGDGSRIVTIDDWGADGYGEHVVVLYDSQGKCIRNYSLGEIASDEAIRKMQVLDKKLLWRGDCMIVNDNLIIKVVANGEIPLTAEANYRTITIILDYGSIIPEDIDYLPDIEDYIKVEIPAKPINYVHPNYPELCRRMEQEGIVYVKMLVDPNGSVMNVVVIKSSGFPELDSAAVEAAYKWTFIPAQLQGKPVRVWVAAPIKFELE